MAFICFCLARCSPAARETTAPATDSSEITGNRFLPVADFLQAQLLELDSLPVTFQQVLGHAGGTDSSWVNHRRMQQVLQPFAEVNLNATNLSNWFSTSKFNDAGLGMITYTYLPTATLPDSIALRRCDVYIKRETGRIERVFIRQFFTATQLHRQLTWKTGRSAQITEWTDAHPEQKKSVGLIWNFTPEKTADEL